MKFLVLFYKVNRRMDRQCLKERQLLGVFRGTIKWGAMPDPPDIWRKQEKEKDLLTQLKG